MRDGIPLVRCSIERRIFGNDTECAAGALRTCSSTKFTNENASGPSRHSQPCRLDHRTKEPPLP
jgi:hypothetical protein